MQLICGARPRTRERHTRQVKQACVQGALLLQAGGAPAPQPIWQDRIPGNIAMGGFGSGSLELHTETQCRVYSAPPERLDDVDAECLTAVAFATGGALLRV